MKRMTSQKALAQRDHLRRVDRGYGQLTLLHGTELNIGPDGGLDWPGEFLTGFDL
jgi:DNA polymerase (family 10)